MTASLPRLLLYLCATNNTLTLARDSMFHLDFKKTNAENKMAFPLKMLNYYIK